ncbi:MAG: Fe-S protein assembly co-chaperone HscB [Saprospiraceae bacterium]|nr:Fe-S protein assembly co-chaperone HscB [Saprospiraceae bacterium]
MELVYFKVLEIPFSFRPDLVALKKNFYKLSRWVHPDHFTLGTADAKEEALLKSSEINTAYNTLKDEDLRLKYILESYGLLRNGENQELDQEFLMEMMDLNEVLFELQMDFDADKYERILKEIEEKKLHLKSGLNKAIDLIEQETDSQASLEKIRDIYLKNRYLLRIHENISTFAPQ